jgi:hypothetical protein
VGQDQLEARRACRSETHDFGCSRDRSSQTRSGTEDGDFFLPTSWDDRRSLDDLGDDQSSLSIGSHPIGFQHLDDDHVVHHRLCTSSFQVGS